MSRRSPARRIGFLFTPDFALMSAASAVEPLRAANLLSGRDLYELIFLSSEGGWLRSSVLGGFETRALSEMPGQLDLLFVVSGGDPMQATDPATLAALRRLARQGVPLGGISGGATLLAAAGVMQDRRYTIHWMHVDEMRSLYPEAMIERRLFVIDRDRYTCAGGMAPLDMMHALITAEHGAELARAVSDWFIHTGIRSAEAPQQQSPARSLGVTHPALEAMLDLMSSHIADPLTLEDLAKLSGVSTRQLERLCRAQLGQSVMAFYRGLRLDKADEILRRSSLGIDAIAQATGFGERSPFSRAFRRRFGSSPAARRKATRG
ncbi:GlxA family transcriptional regulator [Salipiger sp. CCB-MM3]|uniref:GlxA family transcriptional regulator n=1 Tax=Salipiger sp. CCB-MM3 TaxID=1792508 RepID=UPI000B13628B|nr:GlxA family transcriptional regulator [Salipiger sp. CCB-MM3]